MTAQEVIETAQLRVGDTDPSGRTMLEFLSYLSVFYKALYDYVVKWNIDNVNGFERTRLPFAPVGGSYTLPVNHLHTSKMWCVDLRREASYIGYDVLENMYAFTEPDDARYSIYNGSWYVKPDGIASMIAYYFPILDTLTLISTWPGNGELDNAAVDFIVNNVLLSDRFAKYDINVEAQTLAASVLRARYALLRNDPKVRTPKFPLGSYINARN